MRWKTSSHNGSVHAYNQYYNECVHFSITKHYYLHRYHNIILDAIATSENTELGKLGNQFFAKYLHNYNNNDYKKELKLLWQRPMVISSLCEDKDFQKDFYMFITQFKQYIYTQYQKN